VTGAGQDPGSCVDYGRRSFTRILATRPSRPSSATAATAATAMSIVTTHRCPVPVELLTRAMKLALGAETWALHEHLVSALITEITNI
jgi:hypothetical protein